MHLRVKPLVCLFLLFGLTLIAHSQTFQVGDVFGSTGNGQVTWYHPDGTLVRILDTGIPGTFTTGMAFDKASNLYVTNFSSGGVFKFDNAGNLIGLFASGFSN